MGVMKTTRLNAGEGSHSLYRTDVNVRVGTYDARLAKFDGNNWTVYSTGNSGLPSNGVWALAKASMKSLTDIADMSIG